MMPRALRSVRAACSAAAIAAALTFGVAGCAPAGDDLSAELHASVVQIAERAAAGDFAGALAELELLDQDVAAAVEDGAISDEREQEIRIAIDLVRADLQAAAQSATPPPAPPSEDDEVEGDEDDGNNGNGNGGDGGNSGNGNGGDGGNGNGGGGSEEPSEPPASEPPASEPPATTPPASPPPASESPEGGDGDG